MTDPIQRTHYVGCWRSHHECAAREVARLREELRAANAEIERVTEERDRYRRALTVYEAPVSSNVTE